MKAMNKPSEVVADLAVGPTSEGRVRIYVETPEAAIPMDFEPDEAEEIAEELRAAAAAARQTRGGKGGGAGGAV